MNLLERERHGFLNACRALFAQPGALVGFGGSKVRAFDRGCKRSGRPPLIDLGLSALGFQFIEYARQLRDLLVG